MDLNAEGSKKLQPFRTNFEYFCSNLGLFWRSSFQCFTPVDGNMKSHKYPGTHLSQPEQRQTCSNLSSRFYKMLKRKDRHWLKLYEFRAATHVFRPIWIVRNLSLPLLKPIDEHVWMEHNLQRSLDVFHMTYFLRTVTSRKINFQFSWSCELLFALSNKVAKIVHMHSKKYQKRFLTRMSNEYYSIFIFNRWIKCLESGFLNMYNKSIESRLLNGQLIVSPGLDLFFFVLLNVLKLISSKDYYNFKWVYRVFLWIK